MGVPDQRLDRVWRRIDAVPVSVSVQRSYRRGPDVSNAVIRKRAERMLAVLGLEDAELSILLCDDATIRELNRRHRKRDRPTDVLAFAMSEGAPLASALPGLLGDVVISVPTAARQAKGADTLREVTDLLAHGLLHLLGFDHRNDTEDRRMRARSDGLVAAALGTKPIR